jgi:peptidoglycan/LPS O-acetylase OafA/YrhL
VQMGKDRRFYLLPILALAAFFTAYSSPIACFVYGYMLAELYHARPKNLKYIATALFPLIVLGVTFINWHDNSFHLIVLATAMVFAGCFSPWLQAFFSNRLSHFLGVISFPLYLIHISIICSVSSRLYLYLTDNAYSAAASAWIVTISTIALAIGLAWLLVPVDRFSTRFSRKIGEKALSYAAFAQK